MQGIIGWAKSLLQLPRLRVWGWFSKDSKIKFRIGQLLLMCLGQSKIEFLLHLKNYNEKGNAVKHKRSS